jgi:hypothetical protein
LQECPNLIIREGPSFEIPKGLKRRFFTPVKKASLVQRDFFSVLDVFHHIFDAAVQNFTEHVDRMRADALVPLQPRDLRRTDMVRFYQRVLRNAPFLHRFPEFFVRNHAGKPHFPLAS